MKRYVVLSVNENPKYLYYLPLVMWAWRQFRWDIILFYARQEQTNQLKALEDLIEVTRDHEPFRKKIIKEFHGYKSETIAQASRMYAAHFYDGFIMTSDADMLPLSNYWTPDEKEITCYGRDLSNEHFPMCYVAMPKHHWITVMNGNENIGLDGLFWDLNHWYPLAKNKWCVDQDILTSRITGFPKKLINRGTDPRTGYPIGRVDRSAWRLDHKQLIDCHLPHDILTNDKSFHNVLNLLHLVWPKEDWTWFINYHKEFKKLL